MKAFAPRIQQQDPQQFPRFSCNSRNSRPLGLSMHQAVSLDPSMQKTVPLDPVI
jgi:hypothetical protein